MVNQLSREAFNETINSGVDRVIDDTAPPFDFWEYFEAIPVNDFDGYDCTTGQVQWVWRSKDCKFEHVLINALEDKNVFMVLVLNLHSNNVYGHRLLNLNNEYEIDCD